MGPDLCLCLAAAAVVLLAVVLLAAGAAARRGDPFAGPPFAGHPVRGPPRAHPWAGGRGPYGLQLYDSPRYYPYYEARDYLDAWNRDGRCAAYCAASEDGGCAVACR